MEPSWLLLANRSMWWWYISHGNISVSTESIVVHCWGHTALHCTLHYTVKNHMGNVVGFENMSVCQAASQWTKSMRKSMVAAVPTCPAWSCITELKSAWIPLSVTCHVLSMDLYKIHWSFLINNFSFLAFFSRFGILHQYQYLLYICIEFNNWHSNHIQCI